MAPDVEARFQRIESLLHAMTKRDNRMDIRIDQKHSLAMQRMDRLEAMHNQRMDRLEKQMGGMQKLMKVGMRMIVNLQTGMKELQDEGRQTRAELRALTVEVRQLTNSLRNGRNGRTH